MRICIHTKCMLDSSFTSAISMADPVATFGKRQKIHSQQSLVKYTFNPTTVETEFGGSQRIPGQPGLFHRETRFQETNKQNKTKTNKKFSLDRNCTKAKNVVFPVLNYQS